MPVTSTDLLRAVDWVAVLQLLEIPEVSARLPACYRCPCCAAPALHLYEDIITRHPWHHCKNCHSSGDLIALAAATWQVQFATAARMLAERQLLNHGALEEALSRHADRHLTRQVLLQDSWQKAKQRFLTKAYPRSFDKLLSRLHLRTQFPTETWAANMQEMLGSLYYKEAAYIFERFIGVVSPTVVPIENFSRVFHGSGWDEVLVVPYYDLPGRINAFYFLGRGGNPDVDRSFRKYAGGWRKGEHHRRHEAGLMGLEILERSQSRYDAHVLILPDPVLALQLQARHLNTASAPLPIIAWHEDARHSTRNWNALTGRCPVFFAWQITPDLVNQAMLADGKIAFVALRDASRPGVHEYLHKREPRDTLAWLLGTKARPWREVLAQWCAQATDNLVLDLLHGICAYGHDVSLLRGLSARLNIFLERTGNAQRLESSFGTFVERGGYTYIEKIAPRRQQQILNCIMRFDFKTTLDKKTMYHGRLLIGEDVLSFALVAEVFTSVNAWRERGIPALTQLTENLPGFSLLIDTSASYRLVRILLAEIEQV